MKTTKELAKELGLLRKRTLSSCSGAQRDLKSTDQQFSYLIIIDFESTCWKDDKFKTQEIIEFPAVLLNTSSGKIESEFHYYVQPQEQPTLSAFCTELTGITQDKVDDGIPISLCLKKFCHWLDKLLREKDLVCYGQKTPEGRTATCTIVTWSDWDLGVCLQYECKRKQLLKPVQLTSWIDLRATYRKFYDRKPNGLNGALQDLGIEFEGREHSGLDDSRNTAKLAYRMIKDGCVMKITKTLKNQDTAQSKAPSVKNHFLPATRISPPRKAKSSTPTMAVASKQSPNLSAHSSGSVLGKSKIPRPVSISESEREPDCVRKIKMFSDIDCRSPVAKRRKVNSPKTPKLLTHTNAKTTIKKTSSDLSAKTVTQRTKTPNKPAKRISPTNFKSVDIYVDPVESRSKNSNPLEKNSVNQPGLKAQDSNVPTNSSSTSLSPGKTNKQSPDKTFKKPLSPSSSHIKLNSGLSKGPVSSIKPASKVQAMFQTSTPISRTSFPKGFSKSIAPSPIGSVNSSSSSTCRGVITPPSTPVNKKGRQTTILAPTSGSGELSNSGKPIFKTPSPVTASRNTGNSSSVFKTPSMSGAQGSAMKSTPPLCRCGRRSKRRMVQSPGQNTGRFFFSCSVRHSAASKNGCDFFKWETAYSPASNSSISVSGKKGPCVSRQFVPVSRTSFKATPASSFKKNLGVRSVTVTPFSSFRI